MCASARARSIVRAQYKRGPRSKHLICAEPELFTLDLEPDDEFIVMASDGVWDVISDQKSVDIVAKALKEHDHACDQAAKALVMAAYQVGPSPHTTATTTTYAHQP